MNRYTREEVRDTMHGILEHLRAGGVITSMHGLGFAAAEKARRKGLSTMRVDLRIFDPLVEGGEVSDTGASLIGHHLLSELVAEGLLEKEGTQFFYRGPRQDYRIEMNVTAVNKTVRLSED